MRCITMFQTRDGKVHKDEEGARRYAENAYGNALTRLAQQALKAEKYIPMCQFLEDNLEAFVELKALREDIERERAENDE